MIQVSENISLRARNSFQMEASAAVLVETNSKEDLLGWIKNNPVEPGRLLLLGGGSNLLLTGNFKGSVIHPVNTDVEKVYEDSYCVGIRAGAGKEWDELVEWTVNQGYAGLENLSMIPGTVGAAPIQNIGAYGAEAGALIDSVEVIDLISGKAFNLDSWECHFGYRDSIFKTPAAADWLVWSVTFRLDKEQITNLSYAPLKKQFQDKPKPSVMEIRQAVMEIRRLKLPDPAEVGNAGSFFKNPVVSPCQAALMRQDFPELPLYYQDVAAVKLSAGWLIEQCGWKGFREGRVGVHAGQALVLVNYGGAAAWEIIDLSEKIRDSVKRRFNIRLEPEVRIV